MNKLLNNISCSKKRHETKAIAEKQALEDFANHGNSMRVYQCQKCKQWHCSKKKRRKWWDKQYQLRQAIKKWNCS